MEASAFGLSLAIMFGFMWGVAISIAAGNLYRSKARLKQCKITKRRQRLHRHV